jgi:hypothetical protein
MGFGFNLGMIFIVLPLTGILLLIWLVSQKRIFGVFLAVIWGGIFGLIILSFGLRPFFEKIVLDKEDYYGEYIINSAYFTGSQSDWQYNHFRFEITKDDSIFFYETDDENILTTHKGVITYPKPYNSARLDIKMNQPAHHVTSSNPTTYRQVWDFYLVFHSTKFDNMFFKKDTWKPIGK